MTFAGFGGHPVKGWLTLPAGADGPLPLVVEFVGYGGGRGLPHEHLLWAVGRLRALRHGHPRSGQRLGRRRRHGGPGGRRAPRTPAS